MTLPLKYQDNVEVFQNGVQFMVTGSTNIIVVQIVPEILKLR
ncbi:hypothetical protein [Planktothrix agardhii]|jgi:hypothetical protein|uniref:Uncharacterized protein n=1 Tax=Planktothrix agardhii TaxID=1160 RepID=A0AAD1Q4F7_PLAAG|nr:hypothetical protein [Planktothrix agardhii]BBD55618.1 hypothetical protein NIES204_29290 [Planktothrix agardhii NIES-204]MDS1347205.1 hypothetical protein [Planktothrix agardhii NRERC-751]MEA5560839.1 hypothetical protein [Planktothrix agardhii UHCC 0887]CAD5925321.1 hypothetical protein NO365_00937 [Planktothrix agardhii]CAD5933597.1 hypothetical protein NIVACYA_01900 [Planktothrix agardhii]